MCTCVRPAVPSSFQHLQGEEVVLSLLLLLACKVLQPRALPAACTHTRQYVSRCRDQRLYVQELREGGFGAPRPLTPEDNNCRYADGMLDEARGRLVVVCEDHSVSEGQQPVNTISSVGEVMLVEPWVQPTSCSARVCFQGLPMLAALLFHGNFLKSPQQVCGCMH